MTTWHENESLDEALWFALTVGFSEECRDRSECALVAAADSDSWREQLRARLEDTDRLRREVVGPDPA
jgi:hypothetical protein